MGHKDQEAEDQEGGDQTAARNQGQPGEAQEEEVIGVYQLVPDRVLDLEPVMGDLGPTGFSRAILAPWTGGVLRYLSVEGEDDGSGR